MVGAEGEAGVVQGGGQHAQRSRECICGSCLDRAYVGLGHASGRRFQCQIKIEHVPALHHIPTMSAISCLRPFIAGDQGRMCLCCQQMLVAVKFRLGPILDLRHLRHKNYWRASHYCNPRTKKRAETTRYSHCHCTLFMQEARCVCRQSACRG